MIISVSMVLGIPTVKRQVQSYLMTTLQNLIDSMSARDLETCLIVVMVAEVRAHFIYTLFRNYYIYYRYLALLLN